MNKIVCLRSVAAMRTAYYRANTILDDQVGRDFMHAAARDISPSRSSTKHMQFPLPAYYIISEPFLDAAENRGAVTSCHRSCFVLIIDT
ncbi:hypothetical protein [Sphingosinicella microcystinivorans]|uniref:hypothetical protein n=1 Tax=Sphingosinicella microcystinivorans TaxID=335406 RepID=UPI000EB5BD4F|nr:hypothetical protein [Sphingosinicella microcystinivorans]